MQEVQREPHPCTPALPQPHFTATETPSCPINAGARLCESEPHCHIHRLRRVLSVVLCYSCAVFCGLLESEAASCAGFAGFSACLVLDRRQFFLLQEDKVYCCVCVRVSNTHSAPAHFSTSAGRFLPLWVVTSCFLPQVQWKVLIVIWGLVLWKPAGLPSSLNKALHCLPLLPVSHILYCALNTSLIWPSLEIYLTILIMR